MIITSNKKNIKDLYLSKYEWFCSTLNGQSELPFKEIRDKAINRFSKKGFPTLKDEEWKYTNVSSIINHEYTDSIIPDSSDINIENYCFGKVAANLLVFINGTYSDNLSRISADPNEIIIDNLLNAFSNHPEKINTYLAKHADIDKSAFTALNTAFIKHGSFINVCKNAIIKDPIHILNISNPSANDFIAHKRNLIIAEENSEFTIIESYHGERDQIYFNNVVNEIIVEENAKVDHYKIQQESLGAYHIATTEIDQERGSTYTSFNIDLGGKIVRNDLEVNMNAEYCETNFYGLYIAKGHQHIDNHTLVNHAKPHCNSNELYKGILDENSRAVFNGKIIVHQDAQKTNAFQSNKNILLSKEAIVNTKPQLEIFADDVKCSHGATIGQMDEEALFYMRARGIGKEEASSILRFAFVGEVIEKIKEESIKAVIEQIIKAKFKK